MLLPDSAKKVIEGPFLAHVATLNESGSVHISVAWAGLEDDRVVIGTLFDQKKLQNIRRDPRVTVSFQTDYTNEMGLREYLVIKGEAEVTAGGGADLLSRLATVYLGPDVKFPPMPDPPDGFVTRITVNHLGGVGPWKAGD